MQQGSGNIPFSFQRLLGLSSSRSVLILLIFFGLYFVTARFGLEISAVNRFAALVWAPTGLALAALLLFGWRLWPAIFLGAFCVNWVTGAPAVTALGIATGNTLEALLGFYLCTFRPGFHRSLDRVEDVVHLLIGGAFLSTLVSASIGVTSLFLSHILKSSDMISTWTQWWSGDMLGDLMVAPLLLIFSERNFLFRPQERRNWIEPVIFATVLVVFGIVVLGPTSDFLSSWLGLRGIYLLIPLLLWSALRFGQRGSVLASFTISTVALWNTVKGEGPFGHGSPLQLMVFVMTIAMTGLFVGAVASEREQERQNLRQREQELKQAKDAAEAANLAKSAFLANMSHEIRTPLGAVLGFSELIIDPAIEPSEKDEFVAAIKRNGELLSNIINDILDLSKVEAGKMEADPRSIRMSEIISDMKMLFNLPAQEKNIGFEIIADGDVPEVIFTDGMRLRQILLNLIGNAIKFTIQGQVKLRIQRRDEHQLAFIVSDTGRGIGPDEREKLFHPFSQVDMSIRRKFGGTGLGLVLSRRLAELLGGKVELTSSEPGRGSVFTATIDVQLRAEPQQDVNHAERRICDDFVK